MSTPFVLESPIDDFVEGETRSFVLTIPGATSITGTPTIAMYLEESVVSSTYLSGTNGTTDGVSTVTTTSCQSMKGGETYYLVITAVVNNQTNRWVCEIPVRFPWGAR